MQWGKSFLQVRLVGHILLYSTCFEYYDQHICFDLAVYMTNIFLQRLISKRVVLLQYERSQAASPLASRDEAQ